MDGSKALGKASLTTHHNTSRILKTAYKTMDYDLRNLPTYLCNICYVYMYFCSILLLYELYFTVSTIVNKEHTHIHDTHMYKRTARINSLLPFQKVPHIERTRRRP